MVTNLRTLRTHPEFCPGGVAYGIRERLFADSHFPKRNPGLIGVIFDGFRRSSFMNHLLVIGGASFDVLHLQDQTVATAGGAGMYTAMAARRCGAPVSLFGPRPDP